jgi:hypothetical protein
MRSLLCFHLLTNTHLASWPCNCCSDLFIELHFGPRRYVDPEPFANSLQLNHAIQQVLRCGSSLQRGLQIPTAAVNRTLQSTGRSTAGSATACGTSSSIASSDVSMEAHQEPAYTIAVSGQTGAVTVSSDE